MGDLKGGIGLWRSSCRRPTVRTAELHLSLQNTVEDRVSALKSNYEALLVAAKEKEAQLVKSFEAKSADFQGNYMPVSCFLALKSRKRGKRELHLQANSPYIR